MLIRKPADITSSEITPEGVYHGRRQFMAAGALGLTGLALPHSARAGLQDDDEITPESIVSHTTTSTNLVQIKATPPPTPMR